MKRRDDVNSNYFSFFEGDFATVSAGLPTQLRQLVYNMPEEHRPDFRVLLFIDAGPNLKGLPVLLVGLTPDAACFDVHMPDLLKCLPAIDLACERLGAISHGPLRVGFGNFNQDEYENMRRYSIYNKRMFHSNVADWLLFKNISRRAGRFGWLWNRFVQRFDDKEPVW